MSANDVARDREAQPVASLLGRKERFKNAINGLARDWTGRIDHINS